ncbi:MAG: NAD(P)H-dependent oxidoreductase subunit E [Bacteroidales bacterium]|jgi:NADH-quinone oxidoreductase subunit E|nr:NAD(P)H-dependent oxidoreductase subunit E [Bacteroidales bacterium]
MSDVTEIIKKQINQSGKKREVLLPILQSIVERDHYLSSESLLQVAKSLDISAADVYGTASFYSFLETNKKLGKYVIRVCKTIVCDMQGKREIIEAIENCLDIRIGETTRNNKFSLLYTNCLGWCHKGPVMLINNEVYTELTPDKVRRIINAYKQNKQEEL